LVQKSPSGGEEKKKGGTCPVKREPPDKGVKPRAADESGGGPPSLRSRGKIPKFLSKCDNRGVIAAMKTITN